MALPPAFLLQSHLFVLHPLRQMVNPLFPAPDQAPAARKQLTSNGPNVQAPNQTPQQAPQRKPAPRHYSALLYFLEPPVQYQSR
jgi:hypothetical protein